MADKEQDRKDYARQLSEGYEAKILALRVERDELREALKDLLACSPCRNGCDPKDMTCATNKARAALAKSEKGGK